MSRFVPAIVGVPKSASYSEVIESNGFVFLAGQVGDTEADDGFVAEVRSVYDKIRQLLDAVGLDLTSVVRCTVYLRDFDHFTVASDIFREYFPVDPPVRTTVGVSSLARDRRIEVDVTAAR